MSKYLLIASRDPFETGDVAHYYDVAANLVAEGNEVTLFLVQNGVLPARKSTQSAKLTELSKAGVEVLADEFSLRERGISEDRIAEGVASAPLSTIIDHMEQGSNALWH